MSLRSGLSLEFHNSLISNSPTLNNQAGFLTPIASSPRPFNTPAFCPSTSTNIPHISLPISTGSPSVKTISLPSNLSESAENQKDVVKTGNVKSVEIGTPSPVVSINLPQSAGTEKNLGLSIIQGLPPIFVHPNFLPFNAALNITSPILKDNETGPLNWLRPDPPQPLNQNSSYRRVGVTGDGSCFFHAISKGLSDTYQLSYKRFDFITEAMLGKFEKSVNQDLFPPHIFDPVRGVSTTYKIKDVHIFNDIMEYYRRLFIKNLRGDFANRILTDPDMQFIVREHLSGHIEVIKSGQPSTITDAAVFNMVLQELSNDLLSGNAVQPDFMILLSEKIGVDIYLLRDSDISDPLSRSNLLYGGVHLHSVVYGPSDMRSPSDKYYNKPNRNSLIIIAINDFHYDLVARIDTVQSEEGTQEFEIHPRLDSEDLLVRKLYKILSNARLERISTGEKD